MSLVMAVKEWTQLVRFGVPQFEVIRRPILFDGQTIPPGTKIPESLASNLRRVRQLYEQRAIQPIAGTVVPRPPKGTPAAEAQVPIATLNDLAMQVPIPVVEVAVQEVYDDEPIVTGVVSKKGKRS